MQCIGPDDGFDARLPGVHPNQRNGDHYRNGKGQFNPKQRPQNKAVQYDGHQIQPKARPHNSREQKERCSGFVAGPTKPATQVSVDGGQLEPVVQRQEHQGNHPVSHQVPQNHLKVGELVAAHGPWNGDESHPGQACANHPKSHYKPRRTAISEKKSLVTSAAPSERAYADAHQEVNEDDQQDDRGLHTGKDTQPVGIFLFFAPFVQDQRESVYLRSQISPIH